MAEEQADAKQEAKQADTTQYVTLWFTPTGDLKCKVNNLSIYNIIGILTSTLRKFESLLDKGMSKAEDVPPPQGSQPG